MEGLTGEQGDKPVDMNALPLPLSFLNSCPFPSFLPVPSDPLVTLETQLQAGKSLWSLGRALRLYQAPHTKGALRILPGNPLL